MNKLLIGYHVEKDGSYAKSVNASVRNDDINSAQIFVTNPRTGMPSITDDDAMRLANYVETNNIALFVHSSYVTTLQIKSFKRIVYETQRAAKCGAKGYVIHIHKNTADEIAAVISELFAQYRNELPIRVLIEPIGIIADSKRTYETAEKLNTLWDKLNVFDETRLGLVLDTAHMWVTGNDISSRQSVANFLAQFRYTDRLKLIHFNGSESSCGSGRDRHAVAFGTFDMIWGGFRANPAKSGAAEFVQFAIKNNIPLIYEAKSDYAQMRNIENGIGSLAITKSLATIDKIGGSKLDTEQNTEQNNIDQFVDEIREIIFRIKN